MFAHDAASAWAAVVGAQSKAADTSRANRLTQARATVAVPPAVINVLIILVGFQTQSSVNRVTIYNSCDAVCVRVRALGGGAGVKGAMSGKARASVIQETPRSMASARGVLLSRFRRTC